MAGNDWLPSSTKPKKFKGQDDLKLKRMSIMAAALQVLQDRKVLMNCPETIDVMATEGLWDNPGGKTPVSTLFTVFGRSFKDLGKTSPFNKTEQEKFEAKVPLKD